MVIFPWKMVIFPLNMVIFHSYVSLPEGIPPVSPWLPPKISIYHLQGTLNKEGNREKRGPHRYGSPGFFGRDCWGTMVRPWSQRFDRNRVALGTPRFFGNLWNFETTDGTFHRHLRFPGGFPLMATGIELFFPWRPSWDKDPIRMRVEICSQTWKRRYAF